MSACGPQAVRLAACAAAALCALAPAAASRAAELLDDFSNPALWRAQGSDDVTAVARVEQSKRGRSLCLDFDLAGTAGYASLRRELPLTHSAGQVFRLTLRGDAPANDFQFKLVDASGANVWWHRRPDFVPPGKPQTIEIGADAIDFAWGPSADKSLTRTASLELTVAAGHGGGKGSICFARLERLRSGTAHKAKPKVEDERASANAELAAAARASPRGHFPRALVGEQNYWTVLGLDGGPEQALLSEDGAIETRRGGWSLEPFLIDEGALVTWADVEVSHALEDGYLPLPTASWRSATLGLDVAPVAQGTSAAPEITARYTLVNRTERARHCALVLALRPIQVNPPTQFLNAAGGASAIGTLRWSGRRELEVNGAAALRFVDAEPSEVSAEAPLDVAAALLAGSAKTKDRAILPAGHGSAWARFDLELEPGASRTVVLRMPIGGASRVAGEEGVRGREQVAAEWREKLNTVGLTLPPQAAPLGDTVRSALAHILIERNGPALQPGTRSYARSWIRDGAMMSEGLLRLGHGREAAAYVEWYAAHLFKNGKVPCCVDYRGSDPTPENDSAGEFVWLVGEVFRYEHDRALLERLWPSVRAAMAYLERLRQSERTASNQDPARAAYFGLLPPSISHEGYSAKPAYSYWDDFWGYAGYRSAVSIAQALGEEQAAAEYARQRDEFEHELVASIRASAAQHHVDFLPGAADLGDFDATSSTIAFAPAGIAHRLPQDQVARTFERYWDEFVARRDGAKAWDAYTPYEWRTVGSFVRLGWRDRAQQLVQWFMADRRPAAWNQWAEVVGREPRQPRFVGDMPHGWVASDFIRAALDLFAYERETDRSLVLAAGVPSNWLDEGGISIERLRTPYGSLSYAMKREGRRLVLRLEAGATPPGGFVVRWPGRGTPGATRIDGRRAQWRGDELAIAHAPAKVVIEEPKR